ncbi:MAG: DUF998 domain-containing protein [Chloroflexota bacterium]
MATATLSPHSHASRLASTSTTVSATGVICFAVLVIVLHFLRPELSPLSEPTSAYAVGSYSFLMTAAFFSMSVACFALVIALYQRRAHSAKARMGLVFLGLWAAGVLVAMVFPMDPNGAPSTISGTIHQTAGPLTFLCLSVGMILVSWAWQDGRSGSSSRAAITLSLVMLAAFVATFVSFITDLGTAGIAQRIALATAVTWILVSSMSFRSLSSEPVSA